MRRRGIAVAVSLCIGLIVGVAIAPAGAHVTNRFSHLWSQHIKPALDREGYAPVVGYFETNVDSINDGVPLQGETLIANLSQDGTGYLEVPFPARVMAHGSVVLYNRSAPDELRVICRLNIGPPAGTRMSAFGGDVFLGTSGDTIPLVGHADVEPGVYDVSITCEGFSPAKALNANANVMAVRR